MNLLFGLTGAEQEICKLIANGYSTQDMAEIRSTNPNTVRAQVKSLLSKTGSSHSVELVRLALSINLPIDYKDK